MIPFYDKSKPSEFLQAMVDGLNDLYPNQDVNMNTFGRVTAGVCYGCAATYALQNLLGRQLTWDEFRQAGTRERAINWDLDGEDAKAVGEFEAVMNMARLGRLLPLVDFCELEDLSALDRWYDQWEFAEGLDMPLNAVRKAIAEMQEVGL